MKISARIISFFIALFVIWSTSIIPLASAAVQPTPLFPVIKHYPGAALGSSVLALSSAAQDAQLDKMVAIGIQWVRIDFEWKNVQPQNSTQYNWFDIDQFVAKARARNLTILGVIGYAPAWAAGPCAPNTNCPPRDPALFAKYATAVAERFTPLGVDKWEIWNEPNNVLFWGGKADCKMYSDNLKAAYTAIKKVNPNAGIISGGFAPALTDGSNISPIDFLSCMYKNGAGGFFDAVGHHPYTFRLMPSESNLHAWAQMSTTNPSLRSIMTANGDAHKRIWLTEFGAPTDGPDPARYVNEWLQNSMVTDAINLYMTYPWAGPLFWYTFQDTGTSKTDSENFFGMLRFDGSAKPAYMTYRWAIKAGL